MNLEIYKLVYDDEGIGGLVDGFLTMAIGGAILIVGTFIISEINDTIDANAGARDEINTIVERIYAGMQVGGTAILATGAALTIAALMGVGR